MIWDARLGALVAALQGHTVGPWPSPPTTARRSRARTEGGVERVLLGERQAVAHGRA